MGKTRNCDEARRVSRVVLITEHQHTKCSIFFYDIPQRYIKYNIKISFYWGIEFLRAPGNFCVDVGSYDPFSVANQPAFKICKRFIVRSPRRRSQRLPLSYPVHWCYHSKIVMDNTNQVIWANDFNQSAQMEALWNKTDKYRVTMRS